MDQEHQLEKEANKNVKCFSDRMAPQELFANPLREEFCEEKNDDKDSRGHKQF